MNADLDHELAHVSSSMDLKNMHVPCIHPTNFLLMRISTKLVYCLL
jgi:hypothetical protein